MDKNELVNEFEKLAVRLDNVVKVLEKNAAVDRTTVVTKTATDDFGSLSSLPSRGSNPLMDFILS